MRVFVWSFVLCLCLLPLRARAEVPQAPAESPQITQARALFVEGAELAEKMRWGEAREKFEASAKLHTHPGTSYNVGVCERALGHFTRARRAFRNALSKAAQLDPAMRAEAEVFVRELESVIARLDLSLEPADVLVSVDGRPLQLVRSGQARPQTIAGTRAPGRGERAPARQFSIELDPGHHVLLIARAGYRDVVRQLDVQPGAHQALTLALARLPGELVIDANQKSAVVMVNALDVGVAPVSLSRPAGRYRVTVRKPGFTDYATDATLAPGGRVELDAKLSPEAVLLTERWWFWTGIGVALVGIGVGTYAATRPDPERPPVSGGNLGWSVRVP